METRYISLKDAIDTAKFYEAECDPIPRLIDSLNAIQPADVVPGPRWIPVKERLPEEDEVVLVFGGRSIYTAYYGENRCGGIGWYKLNSKYHNCNPTHWRPLPEPPKEGGGKNE